MLLKGSLSLFLQDFLEQAGAPASVVAPGDAMQVGADSGWDQGILVRRTLNRLPSVSAQDSAGPSFGGGSGGGGGSSSPLPGAGSDYQTQAGSDFRIIATSLFRVLSVMAMRLQPKTPASTSSARFSPAILKLVGDLLHQELARGIDQLQAHFGRALSGGSSERSGLERKQEEGGYSPVPTQEHAKRFAMYTPGELRVFDTENLVFGHLLFVASLYSQPVVARLCSQREVLGMLLRLLVIGSPRIKRIVVRVLRSVLTSFSPRVVEEEYSSIAQTLPTTGTEVAKGNLQCSPLLTRTDSKLPSEFLVFLVETVAATMCCSPNPADIPTSKYWDTCVSRPAGVGAGRENLSVAADVVGTLRLMLQGWQGAGSSVPGIAYGPFNSDASEVTRAWQDGVIKLIKGALQAAQFHIIDQQDSRSEDGRAAAANACAALAILGADCESLRWGSKVVLGSSRGGISAAAFESMESRDSESKHPGQDRVRSNLARKALMRILSRQSPEATVISCGLGNVRVYFETGQGEGTVQDLPITAVQLVEEIPPDLSHLGPDFELLFGLAQLVLLDVNVNLKDTSSFVPGQLWRAQLKSCAVQALQPLLQHPDMVKEAREIAIMERLFQTALSPVALPAFVSSRFLKVSLKSAQRLFLCTI